MIKIAADPASAGVGGMLELFRASSSTTRKVAAFPVSGACQSKAVRKFLR
jgi:hypothetical protein